eukprot:CAMPEP_0113688986 /NCGR_PEP_ID=MMETSP0038_2-20120614/16872_1 /TAXON_ID=2898 /ORGANISM="Cryptomonas paramecium" /LENGTH=247 /DNA_ID=CAMNT_0000609925 /DNA_START=65 /DNA_END=804 /DNA_ORIENTATION=+ /assembly_acc=CAM_ASM_000170
MSGSEASLHRDANFLVDVPRQILALTKKNFILAYRNRTATFLRVFSSFFFILLIFLVNEALKGRFAADPYYKDYPNPPRTVLDGIPDCTRQASNDNQCYIFGYTPAPDLSGGGYHPDKDYASVSDFVSGTSAVCQAADCEEMYRVHQVVRKIMQQNTINQQAHVIAASSVVGFRNQSTLDDFLFNNPTKIKGAYVFASPSAQSVNFVLQLNSTSFSTRGVWNRPYLDLGLPMQAMAHKAIGSFLNVA